MLNYWILNLKNKTYCAQVQTTPSFRLVCQTWTDRLINLIEILKMEAVLETYCFESTENQKKITIFFCDCLHKC